MQLRRDTIGTLAVKLCSHIVPIGRDNIESTKTSRWESAMLQVCHKVTNPEYQQKQHPCQANSTWYLWAPTCSDRSAQQLSTTSSRKTHVRILVFQKHLFSAKHPHSRNLTAGKMGFTYVTTKSRRKWSLSSGNSPSTWLSFSIGELWPAMPSCIFCLPTNMVASKHFATRW